MQPSDRFQLLINHISQLDDIEPAKRRHIRAGLEYFQRQLLTDLDRRDSQDKILSAWNDFYRLTKGSKFFSHFEKSLEFWRALEASVGIIHSAEFIERLAPKRKMTAEDFFLEIGSTIEHQLPESTEKKLLQFAIWYLSVEARLSKPNRTQARIELVYRFIHPRLKAKGLLSKYAGNKEVEDQVKYFIKGSIY